MRQMVMQLVVMLTQAERTKLLLNQSVAEADQGRNNSLVQHIVLLQCLAVATAENVQVCMLQLWLVLCGFEVVQV